MILYFLLAFFINCCTAQLYNKTDYVTILNNENFYTTVLGTKNAWVIEFYNSWCGHCINFAPTWKLFAQDITAWKDTIKVGVVDCSVNENVPLCRDYEIMAYPTIKLFGSNLIKGDRGIKMTSWQTVAVLKDEIIHFIIQQDKMGNSSSTWVDLLEFNGNNGNVFKEAPLAAESAVIILTKNDSLLAEHVILDLGRFPMVYVRKKVVKEDSRKEINKLPSIIYVDRSGKEKLAFAGSTREEISSHVIKELDLLKKLVTFNKNRGEKLDTEEIGAGDGPPEEDDQNGNKLAQVLLPPTSDHVYLVDIENALSYSLRHEVSLHKSISGEKLSALKNYLQVLIKYFPSRTPVYTFLTRLLQYISLKGDSITGDAIFQAIKALTGEGSELPNQHAWAACLGSKPHLRGYPCGLWTTFHTLTVNAAISEIDNQKYNPKTVLRAIHGYVKNFFSCEECSRNFQKMYALDAESYTKVINDEVLWLWRGHNNVNKRLSGDLSEDPMHKKIQFPSWRNCPSCYKDSETFNTPEVLTYLKKIYAKESLILEGAQNLTRTDINSYSVFNSKNPSDKLMILNKERIGSSNFSTFDINLCVMLYGISTLIIICGYLMFMARQRSKRRRIQAFLYKV